VARPWRIRHKLMFGLGVVIGIVGLLLVGSLLGLLSYMTTMKTTDSKLGELSKASDLKQAINELAAEPPTLPRDRFPSPEEDEADLKARKEKAQRALVVYEAQLEETISKHRDPEGGDEERDFIKALKERFQRLDEAILGARSKPKAGSDETPRLRKDPEIDNWIRELVRTADDLQGVIYHDLFKRLDQAKIHYKWSMIIVLSTSILGALLMAGLLRFFYCWMFYPVRDLEMAAGRVAQGDFEHRIEVHSGDEMEQLADAFNNMTGRLREIYRDLNRQVNERSRQLVRSERLASVGFLAAGVAHEINNPLQAITLYSGALEARLAELANHQKPGTRTAGELAAEYEVITKYLKTILEEAFRCKRITERLLEFSRGGERQREMVDLTELVQSVLDVAEPLPDCKGKEIVFTPFSHVSAWANADEIKSVVLNLVVNALDSMDEGGRLTIKLSQRDGMAELQLSDTGCGMTAEVLENIFEPFFTRNRRGKGTGLGLTISHRIINQHGGEIEVSSPGPNQGSTFLVRLPMEPAEESEPGQSPVDRHETEAETRRQAA
jgi:two-component system NtrC family sensor kinase